MRGSFGQPMRKWREAVGLKAFTLQIRSWRQEKGKAFTTSSWVFVPPGKAKAERYLFT